MLWVGGVASNVAYGGAPQGAAWTAPAFLFLAAAIMLAVSRQPLRLALLGLAGFGVEVLGVHAGFPFGRYEYTAALAPALFGVPLALACAWLVLLAYVAELLRHATLSPLRRALLGAAWLVAIDLVIDPLAAGPLRYWRWTEPGWYHGVPLSNFAGWFATGAALLALLPGGRQDGAPAAAWTGLSIVVFFGIIAAAHGLPGPAAVAALLAGAHFIVRRRPLPLA